MQGNTQQAPTVLVTGASGFLAGFIIAALREEGWRVRCARRWDKGSESGSTGDVQCEFMRMTTPQAWAKALQDVDAVVNVAGILRESRQQRFEAIHHDAPLALAQACVAAGIRQFVQISALGERDDGEFIASKHRFDDALLALPLQAIVLRPSVVYSAAGSYGGTTMLRAMAALPGVIFVPGHGEWRMQPLAAEDLALLVVRALQSDAHGCFEVGGADVITLRDYLRVWRDWLRLPPAAVVSVPEPLVSIAVACGERLGAGPMGTSIWTMLRRGNVTREDARMRLLEAFGAAPRPVSVALAARPSQVQDRWHARLTLLRPVLGAGIVLLFLLSAWVGFATSSTTIEALVADSLLADVFPVALARTAAAMDLVLAVGFVVAGARRAVLAGMLALVAGYTIAFGALLPELWLDPLGGLAKNLAILPALALAWVLADRR